jgi:hypothetical protein
MGRETPNTCCDASDTIIAPRGASARFARYLLGDAFMRFYFEFLRPYRRKATSLAHYFTNSVLPSPRFR